MKPNTLKKRLLPFSLLLLALLAITFLLKPSFADSASPLANRLSGKILLQVEDKGKAWYVSPDQDNQRVYLGSPEMAFAIMREFGLGISNADLARFINDDLNSFPARLAGKILLAVEAHGEAYYINPDTLVGHYLGRPADAFAIMKNQALGITNADLEEISILESDSFVKDETSSESKEDDVISEEENTDESVIETEVPSSPPPFSGGGGSSVKVSYSISYHLDGGTNNPANPTKYSKSDATFTLQDPAKLDYNFLGWFDEKDNKITKINKGSTGDIVLTAKWEAKGEPSYTVTYHLNGGENNASNPTTYTALDSDIALVEPSKEGHQFIAWFSSADFTGSKITEIETSTKVDINLYAQWEIFTFTVTFEDHDGKPLKTEIVNWNSSATAPANPAREGYYFISWDIDFSKIVSDTTVKANYQAKGYTITFDSNGGSSVSNLNQDYQSSITAPDNPTRLGYTFTAWDPALPATMPAKNQTLTAQWAPIVYDINYHLSLGETNHADNPSVYTIETDTITLQPATKADTTFSWWLGSDGNKVSVITQGSTGNIDLWPKWEGEYLISYELNGGVNHPDNPGAYASKDDNVALQDPTREAYKFSGWYESSDFSGTVVTQLTKGLTEDTTLYANWTPIEYTITYVLSGGWTNNDKNPDTYNIETETIVLQPATKADVVFDKWLDSTGNTVAEIPQGSTGDIVLSPKPKGTYTITYHLNGGADRGGANPLMFSADAGNITLDSTTKAGYEFLGWYDEEGNKVSEIPAGSTKDFVLFARWANEEKATYTVEHYKENLEGSSYTLEETENLTYNIEELVTLVPKTYPGFSYNESLGVKSGEVPTDGSLTLKAYYDRKSYTVEFVTNGGSDIAKHSYKYMSPVTKPTDPTKLGYDFLGWHSDSDFQAAWNFSSDKVSSDLTLYAKWELINYQINYNLDGGNTTTNPSGYNVKSSIELLDDPIKVGYVFSGWYLEDTYTTKVTQIGPDETGDITLYAKWSKDLSTPAVITLLDKELDLVVGDEPYKLIAKVWPISNSEKLTWSSSNDSVVNVDNEGNLQAINSGEATITAQTEGGVTETATISVTKEIRFFEEIIIDGGKSGSGVTYNTPSAVEEHLNNNYKSIKVNGTEETIAVSNWTKTADTSDNSFTTAAGNYAFVAQLDGLPSGYTNPLDLKPLAILSVKTSEGKTYITDLDFSDKVSPPQAGKDASTINFETDQYSAIGSWYLGIDGTTSIDKFGYNATYMIKIDFTPKDDYLMPVEYDKRNAKFYHNQATESAYNIGSSETKILRVSFKTGANPITDFEFIQGAINTETDLNIYPIGQVVPSGGVGNYSYSLVNGYGDTDNRFFRIIENSGWLYSNSKDLGAGHYSIRVKIKDNNPDNGVEKEVVIVITVTEADKAISIFDLTSYIGPPIVGAEPTPISFTTDEYSAQGNWHSGTTGYLQTNSFAAGQSYDARVNLTAKPGYTLAGIDAGDFKHDQTTGTIIYTPGEASLIIPFKLDD